MATGKPGQSRHALPGVPIAVAGVRRSL